MGSGCAVSSSTTAYNADNEQTKFGSASSMTYDADGELKSDGTNLHLGCAPGIRRPSADSSVYDALRLVDEEDDWYRCDADHTTRPKSAQGPKRATPSR